MKKRRKKGSGGYRPGAKRPLKYGEPTEIVRFSIPISKTDQAKEIMKKWLKQFEAPKVSGKPDGSQHYSL
jgi:hypothetical protein